MLGQQDYFIRARGIQPVFYTFITPELTRNKYGYAPQRVIGLDEGNMQCLHLAECWLTERCVGLYYGKMQGVLLPNAQRMKELCRE